DFGDHCFFVAASEGARGCANVAARPFEAFRFEGFFSRVLEFTAGYWTSGGADGAVQGGSGGTNFRRSFGDRFGEGNRWPPDFDLEVVAFGDVDVAGGFVYGYAPNRMEWNNAGE